MSLSKFESMLKTNDVYFFDSVEFEGIIQHYLDNGKHSLAKKAVKLGLEQHPSAVNLKLLKVELMIFENHLDKAAKLLAELEAMEPNNDEVLIQKAMILSKSNQHKEAIGILTQAVTLVEDASDVWSMIAMEYLYLDDFENARLNFANCIEVDYEDYSSLYNIIYCYEMQQDFDAAIDFLKAYIDKNPYCEVAWHQLGRQYFVLNRFEEALKAFEYAILIDESFIGAYIEIAKSLEELNRYEEAIENYLVTLNLDDPTAFVYLRIGECYKQLGQTDKAIQHYKKAVHEDPLLDKAWLLLTKSYQEQEDYQKAAYYISKALRVDETNSVYWRAYAEIHLKLHRFEEAVKAFYTCLDLEDYSIEIFIGLADVLTFLGEFDDALKVLIKAKRMFKDFAEIEYRLCGLFMIADKASYSLMHLKNGLAIDKDYLEIVKDLYPSVFEKAEVQQLISEFPA